MPKRPEWADPSQISIWTCPKQPDDKPEILRDGSMVGERLYRISRLLLRLIPFRSSGSVDSTDPYRVL